MHSGSSHPIYPHDLQEILIKDRFDREDKIIANSSNESYPIAATCYLLALIGIIASMLYYYLP